MPLSESDVESEGAPDAGVSRGKPRWNWRCVWMVLVACLFVTWCIAIGIHGGVRAGFYGSILAGFAVATVVLIIKDRVLLALGVVLLFFILCILEIGNSAAVRLDTGDQRLLFWGVPVGYRSLKPDVRRRLLSLQDPQVPPQWTWCGCHVPSGSNNPDIMVFHFYAMAAAWVEVDPEIARLIVRDLAEYVRSTHATHTLPKCTGMLFLGVVEQSDDGHVHVAKDWQKNAEVQWYLRGKVYVLR